MNDIERRLAAANPVPEHGIGSDSGVPPFEAVLALADMPATSRQRPGRWLALGGLSGVAAAIVAVALLLGASGGGAANAFAAWRATPRSATPAELSTAQQWCRQSKPPAVADMRGPFAWYLFKAGDRQLVDCRVWPNGRSAVSDPQPMGKRAARDSITTIACYSGGYSAPGFGTHVYLFMYGRAGAIVNAVTILLRDGPRVRATTSHGLWFAWWPGGNRRMSIELTTKSGTIRLRPPQISASCP